MILPFSESMSNIPHYDTTTDPQGPLNPNTPSANPTPTSPYTSPLIASSAPATPNIATGSSRDTQVAGLSHPIGGGIFCAKGTCTLKSGI